MYPTKIEKKDYDSWQFWLIYLMEWLYSKKPSVIRINLFLLSSSIYWGSIVKISYAFFTRIFFSFPFFVLDFFLCFSIFKHFSKILFSCSSFFNVIFYFWTFIFYVFLNHYHCLCLMFDIILYCIFFPYLFFFFFFCKNFYVFMQLN